MFLLIDNPVMAAYCHSVYTCFLTDRGINAFSDDAVTSFLGVIAGCMDRNDLLKGGADLYNNRRLIAGG
jgi:hypothetical protein